MKAILKTFSEVWDLRLARVFLLGVVSGYPQALIFSAMTGWLTDIDLSRSEIGLFSLVATVYNVNFVWAPLVDHLRIPGLSVLGHRKSWIVLCMAAIIVLGALLALTGPTLSLFITATLCLSIATVSATQDLAIDAYRITVFEVHEEKMIGHAAAMATCGWWTGFNLAGMFAFLFADQVGWNTVYFGLSIALLGLLVVMLLFVKEPPRPLPSSEPVRLTRIKFIDSSYVAGVSEFFKRNGMKLSLCLLIFVFTFKLGEAYLGKMVIIFYRELGFTNAEIGIYSKGLGLVITITCSIAAGFFMSKFGTLRGLMLAGIAMAATNFLFAWLAVIGPDKSALVFVQIADGITSALSTVAFVSFMTHFTSHLYAATQYGALASLGTSGRTLLAATSGFVVDWLAGDWVIFFILTALMVGPALLLLWWISTMRPSGMAAEAGSSRVQSTEYTGEPKDQSSDEP